MSDYKRFTAREKVITSLYHLGKYTTEKSDDWYDSPNIWEVYDKLKVLEDKIENGALIELPIGWLNCLKLLVCGAICYADIMNTLQNEMKNNKEYANLYFKIKQVQGSCNRFDLDYLAKSNININQITGFEDLLSIMKFTKEQAEAKLKELQGK